MNNFINEANLENILKTAENPAASDVSAVLKKAALKKGLSLPETALLLNVEDKEIIAEIFRAAAKIKNEIYGERLVLFAPLYVSDYCVNDCAYCAFHARNKSPRKKLTLPEVAEQVKVLEDMGHKRLLLEFGEHPTECPINYVVDVIKTIYATKTSKGGEIRRVNVNIAATTVENYRKLNAAGIGTYQLFQETYHRETYKKLHAGPKADYERQLFAHDRAFQGGLNDLGLGVLFGLYDYKFEVLALLSHAKYLEKTYGVGPHTISVPRLQPAATVEMDLPYAVSEDELLKIIAILRLAVPYTGMIISTRERPEIRAKAFKIGISQTSAGSKTTTGGYFAQDRHGDPVGAYCNTPLQTNDDQSTRDPNGQFNVADHRSLAEIVESILDQGLLPSFCTACYRKGRVGEDFMELAKPGEIQNLCRPNAILTFKEYLLDYASPAVRKKGEKIIEKYLAKINNSNRKIKTVQKLERLEKGERDLYF